MDHAEPILTCPRVKLRPICLAIAVGCILSFLVVPLIGAAAVLILAPPAVGIPIALGAVAFAALLGYLMSSSYHWVELDGDTIRGCRLLTRKIVEMRVGDIVDAHRINTQYLGNAQNAILDFLLKTSDRGLQLSFRDGRRLALIRADMSGIDEFLQALTERMAIHRQGSPSV
jgi:hypothetical protein